MAEPAKLELLTRHLGEPGFKVHQVESSQAYLLFKPKRLPETEWEIARQPRGPDGSRNFTLRSFQRDRYLLLSPKEKFLWEHFDGRHSLTEIGKAFHFQFGSFDYGMIREFLARLYHAGLLQEIEVASDFHRSHPNAQGRRWAAAVVFLRKLPSRLSFEMVHADRYCLLVYQRGGLLLFHPIAFWASVILALAGLLTAIQLAPQAQEISLRLASRPIFVTAAIILLLPVVSILHVLAHALACKSYGRRVREIGFFWLQGVVPTLYADVTDIFMSTRRARVMVDLAGPMVELVLGGVAFMGAYWVAPGFAQSLLFGAGILLWESVIINLYPFSLLEMDGYNILADLLAMPTLRRQALNLFSTLPRRLRAGEGLHRSDWIPLGYLALCFVSLFVYFWAHLDVIGAAIEAWRFTP